MYTVIGYGGTRAFRLLWMMEELELPYRHLRVMPFTDAARAATPGGRLPGLGLPDGTVLLDSTAILTFLADRHNGLTHPSGTIARARQDAAIQRVLEEIDMPMMDWTLVRQRIVPAPPVEGQAAMQARIDRGLEGAAAALGKRDWLAGDSFGIADIVLGHCLHWSERFHTPLRHARLKDYMARIDRRPAYRMADAV